MLGITLGDPNGVGPEILLRTFANGLLRYDFCVYGDSMVLRSCARALGLELTIVSIGPGEMSPPGCIAVRDACQLSESQICPGELSAVAGAAALAYLNAAMVDALAGVIDAIVTLPVNKEAVRKTVPDFVGHTDVIAAACGTKDYTMTLISDRLIVPHVTAHVSLRTALDTVSIERIVTVGRLTQSMMKRLDRNGAVAVLGFNPHAGESGAFGTEEREIITPAIEQLHAEGIIVQGPVPPDTAFMRAFRGDFASVICMYHDQGHIAMKTIGFDDGVNVTVGLPIVRTSVDHGTAFDIAWKGVASTGSFENACRLAAQLAQ